MNIHPGYIVSQAIMYLITFIIFLGSLQQLYFDRKINHKFYLTLKKKTQNPKPKTQNQTKCEIHL